MKTFDDIQSHTLLQGAALAGNDCVTLHDKKCTKKLNSEKHIRISFESIKVMHFNRKCIFFLFFSFRENVLFTVTRLQTEFVESVTEQYILSKKQKLVFDLL